MSQPPYPNDPQNPQPPYGQGQYPPGGYPPPGLGYQSPMHAPPKTYLVEAILVTICCCLPFGIVSIVYAAMAKSNVNSANYQLAQEYAEKAKMWAWIGFGVGLLANLIVFIIQFAAIGAGAAGSNY